MAKKILLIEDEPDIIKVLSKMLMIAGYQVAFSGDAVRGAQQAHSDMPDLILLDLMLPAGGGLNVLKNLARSPSTLKIPVIVLTGMEDVTYKEQVLEMGIKAFIQKPYDFSFLLAEIEKALDQSS